MKDFISGFCYAFSGFKLINKRGIRKFILGPLVINSILFTLIIFLGFNEFKELIDWIESQWQWLSWISWLLWPVFVIINLIVVFFCFSIIANLIASPFNGLLSEATENHLKLEKNNQHRAEVSTKITMGLILGAIFNEIRKLLYISCRAIPLLILFIIPVFQLAAPFIWLIFAAWIMAIEYMEYPLGNHEKEFHEVREWVKDNRNFSLGFGMGVTLFTAVPIVNFLAMPVAITSATKIYMEKAQSEI